MKKSRLSRRITYEKLPLPKGKEAIGVKWVYKVKKNVKGEVERYKARLVAKINKQKLESSKMRYFLSLSV